MTPLQRYALWMTISTLAMRDAAESAQKAAESNLHAVHVIVMLGVCLATLAAAVRAAWHWVKGLRDN